MSMTPAERARQIHEARLELANLRFANPGGGPSLRSMLVVATAIVSIVGSFVGYQMLRQNHDPHGGLLRDQTLTLTRGSDYALTPSGDLKPTSGTGGYFLRVTGSGLSFPAGVYAGIALVEGGKYEYPCKDLNLPPTDNPSSFTWKQLEFSQLCAEPQGVADVRDYVLMNNVPTSGQRVEVDIITWDKKKAALNK